MALTHIAPPRPTELDTNEAIRFGASSSIYYDGTDTKWDLRAAGTGDLMIALAGSFPSPDPDLIHIWKATAGSVTAAANTALLLEDSGSIYMSILSGTGSEGGIKFGDSGGNTRGFVIYDHNEDKLVFGITGSTRMNLDEANLTFNQATTISAASDGLNIYAASGSNVIIGDGARLLTVDGAKNSVGVGVTGPAVNHLFSIRGAWTSGAGSATALAMDGVVSPAAGANYYGCFLATGMQEAGSGTHSFVTQVYISGMTITDASAATTDYATLYISGSSGGASPTGLDLAMWVDAGTSRFDGDIGAAATRVPKIWTTDQDTTNAENVSSWSRVKENIHAYTEDALAILRNTSVVSFSHLADLDPSGRIKLGLLADSITEPLAAPMGEYEFGYGVGPRIDMMGLAALSVRSIQELADKVDALEVENRELRVLVGGA